MLYIVILGAFQAFISIWLLQLKNKKNLSHYLFIVLLIAIATHLLIKIIIFGFVPNESIKQQMNTFINACYGPLVYLYTLRKINPKLSVITKWYTFIPFFILMITYLSITGVFFILNHPHYKLLDLYNNFSLIIIFLVNLYYPLKSLNLIKKNNLNSNNKTEFGIITKICYCLLLIEMCVIISKVSLYTLPNISQVAVNSFVRFFVYILLLIICLLIVKKSISPDINQQDVINKISINTEDLPNSQEKEDFDVETDYEEKFTTLWESLDNYVRNQKKYKDCNLTLDTLAIKTGIKKHYISEILNVYQQKTFYQYINEYRIDYFKKLVEESIDKDETINFLSLAYESGFKSKSSFNRYFKNIVGKTPSEYYKNRLGDRLKKVC